MYQLNEKLYVNPFFISYMRIKWDKLLVPKLLSSLNARRKLMQKQRINENNENVQKFVSDTDTSSLYMVSWDNFHTMTLTSSGASTSSFARPDMMTAKEKKPPLFANPLRKRKRRKAANEVDAADRTPEGPCIPEVNNGMIEMHGCCNLEWKLHS